ncbi:hypothetical protein COCSADRAFT_201252 [Bipolaris sorokiniana ND90Pr]|uniref:Uncharacterized protein n=1 Tax=Cochliobolus sativus (strain ND90Pr / ATCC 201652) TaxID=665912 RepID=M2T0X0_COCSN|nr:uncharacterized protein COCSADRAFT_201252 [Bipolaris sorokiniana ND90Pr]EMD62652.1 hypothetical protein COCSADRAFT_201252 [Bipolaris sorokiniana ND90Pr]
MSGILKSFSRSAPVASRALQQRGQALPPIISRTYASSAVPDQSHPENNRVGASEEMTESQDHMKHDPNESDAKKREKTLEYGQNKPLDAADK